MIARLIAILFLSREVAHRAHLETKSFSQHSALGSFYDEKHLGMVEKLRYTAVEKTDTAIQNLIDTAVETYLSTLYKLRNLS